jgi:hypothetical protein
VNSGFESKLKWTRLETAAIFIPQCKFTHLNRLTGAGVSYRSFTEPYFDSCGIFKDAVISILATIAKQERLASPKLPGYRHQ